MVVETLTNGDQITLSHGVGTAFVSLVPAARVDQICPELTIVTLGGYGDDDASAARLEAAVAYLEGESALVNSI